MPQGKRLKRDATDSAVNTGYFFPGAAVCASLFSLAVIYFRNPGQAFAIFLPGYDALLSGSHLVNCSTGLPSRGRDGVYTCCNATTNTVTDIITATSMKHIIHLNR